MSSRSISSTEFKNEQYEKSLLGIVLSNNSYADSIIPYLLEEDFFVYENKLLFKLLSHLYDNNISINNDQILNHATREKINEINSYFLATIYAATGFPSSIQTYLEELIRLTRLRKIESKIKDLQSKLNANHSSINPEDVILEIQQLLNEIDRAKSGEDFLSTKSVSDDYLTHLVTLKNTDLNSISGLSTGFDDLDKITQGLHGSEMIIIAARPGIGKTALALNIAVNVSSNINKKTNSNHRVAFFSLEMSPRQLMGRIYSMISGVDQFKLKKPQLLTDEDLARIHSYKINKIDKMNLFIDNTYENELQTLLWKCRRLHNINPLDLIVVDYMQLVSATKKGGGENRQMEITRISRSLKTLALELNVPVIVLSQLNRQTELRDDKRPNLADLRESGSIENDADIVMFLYRENYYNSKNKEIKDKDFDAREIGEETELILAKHRGGETGKITLRFLPHTAKFTNLQFYTPSETKGGI
ncbi:replicative DNA helicase [Mycoplasmopsis bovigenitalium]|uniref:replicative DNA helicase n=1 Tax=Mycoplasmopsis bovigenitalium TaxID=2112 RepID=UPI000909E86A|nr:replicative DNA helicase [Mycoplasmopsis bovigenitalium]BAW18523.1 replicative DNA helicase [Mycoplasmopsis bovigenitalium]